MKFKRSWRGAGAPTGIAGVMRVTRHHPRIDRFVAEIILAGFLMPATTRRLTKGESTRAREAFGGRAVPLANKGLVSHGPGK